MGLKFFIALTGMVALSACMAEKGIVADAPPPNLSTTSVQVARINLDATEDYSLNFSPMFGTATFIGSFVNNLEVRGEPDRVIAGGIRMDANFATDALTGRMYNFNISESNDVTREGVEGELTITGTIGDVPATEKPVGVPGSSSASSGIGRNIVQATASGTLTGNFGTERQGPVEINADLIGHARQNGTTDYLSGQMRAFGRGTHTVEFRGRWYGRER